MAPEANGLSPATAPKSIPGEAGIKLQEGTAARRLSPDTSSRRGDAEPEFNRPPPISDLGPGPFGRRADVRPRSDYGAAEMGHLFGFARGLSLGDKNCTGDLRGRPAGGASGRRQR